MTHITRRRFVQITAMAGIAAVMPLSVLAKDKELFQWRGLVLGADASMQIYLPEMGKAKSLVQRCLAEITRLERIFSLHDPQSALSTLNRQGYLDSPPPELAALLGKAQYFSQASDGAFDVTVQPLWQLYASHFAQAHAAEDGPSPAAISAALALVDYRALNISPARIQCEKPGMKVTLNGIAQGYITDKIMALLRAEGITHTLVEMGESYALGGHPGGRAWNVGIRNPHDTAALAATLPLRDRALATSGGYGTRFNTSGTLHHLLDPKTGSCPSHFASVSVLAPDAATADALSTTLSLLAPEKARILAESMPDVGALFILPDGTQEKIRA